MMLPDAVDAITAEFPQGDGKPAETIDITSAGLRADRDVEPALYASRELAVVAFHREALAVLRDRAPTSIVFLDGPHLDKWNITIADSMNTHRVAEPRWSVTARIGLINPGEGARPMGSGLTELEKDVEALKARVGAVEARFSPAPEGDAGPKAEGAGTVDALTVFDDQQIVTVTGLSAPVESQSVTVAPEAASSTSAPSGDAGTAAAPADKPTA